ncbi:hypothetical protein GGR52DRAFT_542259 [Hypoxylon sp. FL1284]|nr:hypothetical protein GGR52DRAFT_542259 [Hypoxylon sp. FL1284]
MGIPFSDLVRWLQVTLVLFCADSDDELKVILKDNTSYSKFCRGLSSVPTKEHSPLCSVGSRECLVAQRKIQGSRLSGPHCRRIQGGRI